MKPIHLKLKTTNKTENLINRKCTNFQREKEIQESRLWHKLHQEFKWTVELPSRCATRNWKRTLRNYLIIYPPLNPFIYSGTVIATSACVP